MGICSSCTEQTDEDLTVLVKQLVPIMKPILITELQNILTAIQLELQSQEKLTPIIKDASNQ